MCRQAARRRARTELPPASSTWGCRPSSSAPQTRNEAASMKSAVGAPAVATSAPPSTGPSTNDAEKAILSAAFALRSPSCTLSTRSRPGCSPSTRSSLSVVPTISASTCLRATSATSARRSEAATSAAVPSSAVSSSTAGSENSQSTRHDGLEGVERTQLAAASGCLYPRNEHGHDERGQGLPDEQQPRDRERTLSVVEYGDHQGDQADPAAQPVDRVRDKNPAQSG